MKFIIFEGFGRNVLPSTGRRVLISVGEFPTSDTNTIVSICAIFGTPFATGSELGKLIESGYREIHPV